MDFKKDNKKLQKISLVDMSHDIRTPMNAIMGFINMAIKDIDDKEKVLHCLHRAENSSEILMDLINNIIDMDRIDKNDFNIYEKTVDVLKITDEIVPKLTELAQAKNIDLQFQIGDIKDRFVLSDVHRINRVLTNLITNSIQYTNEYGWIIVKLEQLNESSRGYGKYQFKVMDNGKGIDDDYLQSLFNYSANKNEFGKRDNGSGLGLPLAKKIIELMNGTIDVQSIQGKGTEFTIVLPLKIQDKNDYNTVSLDTVNPDFKYEGKKVLLVDDNDYNREIASVILQDEGFIVEEVNDGRVAIEKVKYNGPEYYDFILMDIQMPYINGFEATKAIRELFPQHHIPIIALSANVYEEDRQKSLEAGMDEHIAKPIVTTKLLKIIENLL